MNRNFNQIIIGYLKSITVNSYKGLILIIII